MVQLRRVVMIIILSEIFLGIFEPYAFAVPSVSAQSAILIEKNSGRILYSHNAEQKLPMASTTKIITAICAIENGNVPLDQTVEISASAAGVEGSSMYLESGEKMTLRELLYGLMLSSGNDAAVAIAECISGEAEKFADLMNKKAEEIGAINTHFTNPNGLPDENHYSTAHDMAKLTAYAMQNPSFAEIAATKNFKISGEGKAYPRVLSNHNKLLNMYEGCIGVKTGFTKAAGRCLVSAAERGGMSLICVTLNAPNDWDDHMKMFDYGFDSYTYVKLASKDTPVCTAEVDEADAGVVPVYPKEDVYFPLAEGEKYVSEIEMYPELCAPLAKGESVGRISFTIDGKKSGELPLVSGVDAELATKYDIERVSAIKNMGARLTESLKNFFEQWLGIFIM